ncbi:unnamed protein product, partial [Eretmochelys imbricata]
MRLTPDCDRRRRLPSLGRLLLLLLLCKVSAQPPPCPAQCGGRQCRAAPPRCAPGVPAVLDGCACCLVCARQRGESCSERQPCDQGSGLYCARSAGAARGICM